jgi:hypothetical protein
MKMKKLLALLVMAVLTISAASAMEYPKWWEDMDAGETYTYGDYQAINAYADSGPGFVPKTATATLNVATTSDGNKINMVNEVTTYASGWAQESDVYRQLLVQSGSASVQTGPCLKYDSENPACKVTKIATFEQEQLAVFSGDLDCVDQKYFGARFDSDNQVGTGTWTLNHETTGDDSQAEVQAIDTAGTPDVHIIEAYAGQYSSGTLTQLQCSEMGEGVQTKNLMSGEAGLYAGFDNAILPAGDGTKDYILVQLKTDNDDTQGEKFWWTQ